ncbi:MULTISPECIES: SixA phosphatase family protein [unclassified Jeotgalibaca]|uniref:SixA phosphatase family protein n=1 Tax=unclassified Jeotgalibaca TaxID=2621505 RepID=UPI003FD2C1DD
MNGELILIRHGKAGSAEPGKDDFYRPLTQKGKDEFTTFMKTVKPELGTNEIEVWTSPLLRAKQTADIFIAKMGISTYEEKEFLANGDLKTCLKELEAKQNFCVACVGHEPYMSMWVRELTGMETPFPKGAVMVIKFDGEKIAMDMKLSPKG